MSVRYEGAGARDVYISIAKAGEEVGEDTVPEGQMALIIGYDEAFYLEGTGDELRRVLNTALAYVDFAEGKA